MKKADLITGIVLIALAGYVIYEAWQMPPSLTFGPGSAFLPFWLGVILTGLAIVLIIGALWRQDDDKNPLPSGKKLFSVLKLLVGLVVFTLLMETVGFLVNTLIFVFYLMITVGNERWPKALLTGVLTTAGIYLVFHTLLGITLPKGMFGF